MYCCSFGGREKFLEQQAKQGATSVKETVVNAKDGVTAAAKKLVGTKS